MVAFEDISVVCQGAVAPGLTMDCLRSLRSVFPGAEVILSTWEGTDVSSLDADKTVFSPDPGAFMADEVVGVPNNVNRQLVSTRAGLAAAARPYILKTRTDILFENAGFLDFFERYDSFPSPYFKNRLLICNYYTRNPRVMALCFHPSDWVLFGRAGDVRKYYETSPLMTEEEGRWFKDQKKASVFFTNYICRYTPEQQVFLGFLRQYEGVGCRCYYDRTPALIEQTERTFAECFVVLDYGKQVGIRFPKYDPNRYLEKYSLVSHWQWRALWEHYCVRKRSIRWAGYILRAGCLKALAGARRISVRILDLIGLKESVKRLLTGHKATFERK